MHPGDRPKRRGEPGSLALGGVAAHDVRRAFAVFRGLTPPEGATVAAVTTSFPEGRRATELRLPLLWIRDSCYMGQAGASVRGGEAVLTAR